MRRTLSWIKAHKKSSVAIALVILVSVIFFNIRSKIAAVQSVPIKIGDISTSIYGSAQLKTDKAFDLKVGTPAKILEIKKSIGERVAKGDTIIIFDNLPNFRAPIEGIVSALNFKNGETAFAQSTILSIVQPKDFYLEMSLDQKSVRYVQAGQKARISFDGYRDIKIDGQVRSTFSNNGLFYAIIDLKHTEPSFLPGMSADIAIVTETKKEVLLAPLGSIQDGKILVRLGRGRPIEISITTGLDDGNFIEIQSERLKAGDLAVIRATMPGAGSTKGETK